MVRIPAVLAIFHGESLENVHSLEDLEVAYFQTDSFGLFLGTSPIGHQGALDFCGSDVNNWWTQSTRLDLKIFGRELG